MPNQTVEVSDKEDEQREAIRQKIENSGKKKQQQNPFVN